MILDAFLLLTSQHNFLLYQEVACQHDFHKVLSLVVAHYSSSEIELLYKALQHVSVLTGAT